jgi:hypothetical protein
MDGCWFLHILTASSSFVSLATRVLPVRRSPYEMWRALFTRQTMVPSRTNDSANTVGLRDHLSKSLKLCPKNSNLDPPRTPHGTTQIFPMFDMGLFC